MTFAQARCHDTKTRESVPDRIDRVVGGIASALNCTHKLDYVFGILGVVNDPAVVQTLINTANETIGGENVLQLERPLMGSEEFAFFLEKVPGAIFRLGVGNAPGQVLHNPLFNFSDDALPIGIATMTAFALAHCR